MKKIFIGTMLAVSLTVGGCSAKTAVDGPRIPANTAELRELLIETADSGKVMFGHHDDPVYGHTWVGEEGRSDVLETVGEYPAVMSWDLGGLEIGDSLSLDRVPFERIRAEVARQAARGGVNTFSWHPVRAINGTSDSWNVTDTTLVERMTTDSVGISQYREQVRRLADFFNSLTDSTGVRIPVIFRPWHEHTGSWFWWGAKFSTPDQYKELWKIMRDEFDKAGVDNVLWAYSPDRVTTAEQYMERYPGDEYVDIMGSDIYHFNGEEGVEDYREWADSALGVAAQMAKEHGKVLAFTETGSESVPIANWWTEVLLPILKKYPVSYVVVWRNAHDRPNHFYVPYPGHTSEADFRKFHDDGSVLFVK